MKRKCPECQSDKLNISNARRVWFGHNYVELTCYDCGITHKIVYTDDELEFDNGNDPIKTEVLKKWVKVVN